MRRLLVTFAAAAMSITSVAVVPAGAAAATCHGQAATITGTPGDDILDGTDGVDVILGLGGNDRISGKAGNDVICGGSGHDKIDGGSGFDWIGGGPGKDFLRGGTNGDVIRGAKGRDALDGGAGQDTLRGGSQRDVIGGGSGADELFGGRGEDMLIGGGAVDTANGGGGVDRCGATTIVNCEMLPYARELHPDSLGPQTFGSDTEAVLLEFATALGDPMDMGDPDEDSGWIDSFSPFGTCPGTQVRVVRWGNVQIFNTRAGIAEDGEFFTVNVSDPASDREDKRVHTDEGLQWNDTRAQLQVIYKGRATIEPADPYDFWLFYIDSHQSGIHGTFGGDGRYYNDVVLLASGVGCGD
jgi:RTX calcium-binding nonapeptide repeat (4 copies)